MIFQLRNYQRAAIDAAAAHLSDNPLITMPTGAGKTYSAAALVRELGRRTLWLAERRELVDQAAASLRSLGLDVGVILAGRPPYPNRPVQVASVQTLIRRDFANAELVVIDECHHAPGARMQKLLEAYAGVPRIGLTATPFRLDGRTLGDTFGKLIVAAYPDELVAAGVLVEPRVYAPPSADVSGLKIRGGEFEKRGLARVTDKPKLVGDIVRTWKRHGAGMRTALFAVNVEHSKYLIAAFTAAGVPAEHIDGNTPTARRDAALRRLADGRIQVLSNCQVITEGWDLPSLQCAIIARPTASLCLHIQIAGRTMRACEGKRGALILDHAGNFLRHGRVTRRIEYSLTAPVQPENQGNDLAVCPRCDRVVTVTRAACPECGHVLGVSDGLGGGNGGGPREIPPTVDGELEEFDAERFERIQRDRGYREGWAASMVAAAQQYRERSGSWPKIREAVSA